MALFVTLLDEGPSWGRDFSTMADVPRGARIVPIIAPHHDSHFEESSVNDHNPENPPSEQSSQEDRPANSRTTRGKVETECLELASLTQLGLYALPTEGDGNDSPTSRLHSCLAWIM